MDVLLILLSCVLITAAEHSGAYSSPQYAKKFYPGNAYDTNGLLPREKTKVQFRQSQEIQDRYDVVNDTTQYGRSATFLETAGSLLSGAGGHVVSSLAKDFIARSTGSSQVGFDCITQVLSLNLTNLVILIVLKALIMAAGFFGAGAWRGHNYARSIDENKNATYITSDEIRLYLSYLIGQNTNDYDCLYQLSCLNPHQAGPYSSAAELLLQGAVLMNGDTKKFSSYEEITQGIRTAAQWGEDGMSCARYQCGQSQTHT